MIYENIMTCFFLLNIKKIFPIFFIRTLRLKSDTAPKSILIRDSTPGGLQDLSQ